MKSRVSRKTVVISKQEIRVSQKLAKFGGEVHKTSGMEVGRELE